MSSYQPESSAMTIWKDASYTGIYESITCRVKSSIWCSGRGMTCFKGPYLDHLRSDELRAWMFESQGMEGPSIAVQGMSSYFPPKIWKWNIMEHHLPGWRGKLLILGWNNMKYIVQNRKFDWAPNCFTGSKMRHPWILNITNHVVQHSIILWNVGLGSSNRSQLSMSNGHLPPSWIAKWQWFDTPTNTANHAPCTGAWIPPNLRPPNHTSHATAQCLGKINNSGNLWSILFHNVSQASLCFIYTLPIWYLFLGRPMETTGFMAGAREAHGNREAS